MTALRLILAACVLALLGLGARQDYDARLCNVPPCSRVMGPSQVRLESWGLGAYPMDGSAAVNRVRLRNGGSIPPRTTSPIVKSLAPGHTSDVAAAHGDRPAPLDGAPLTPTGRAAIIPARPVGALPLARALISEARWTARADHAAIAHVLLRFAAERGITLQRAVQLRVWRHSHPAPWVTGITAQCRQPAAWLGLWRWPREACKRVVAFARAALRGEVVDPCDGRATGWRARGKATRRALRRGFVAVDCGPVLHTFVREVR